VIPYNDKEVVLRRAREALAVAQLALRDARDPPRRPAALRNVIVFGRSVSNIIENLRSRVERFDEWYKPLSEEMARDPLLKFFYNLRSQILKQGDLGTTNYAHIKHLDQEAMQRLPRPANARGFFMGDRLGGSGWEVEVSPGVVEHFYVDLPDDIGVSGLMFRDAPGSAASGEQDAVKLCALFLEHMERLVNAAEARWLHPRSP
jgi:hypothetical protein